MQQYCSKFFTHTPPQTGDGVYRSKVIFLEHGYVAYQIKRNHEMQQRGREMVEIVQVSLFLLNCSMKTS